MARAPLARHCSAKRCPSCTASGAAPHISRRHWQRPSRVLTSPRRCSTPAWHCPKAAIGAMQPPPRWARNARSAATALAVGGHATAPARHRPNARPAFPVPGLPALGLATSPRAAATRSSRAATPDGSSRPLPRPAHPPHPGASSVAASPHCPGYRASRRQDGWPATAPGGAGCRYRYARGRRSLPAGGHHVPQRHPAPRPDGGQRHSATRQAASSAYPSCCGRPGRCPGAAGPPRSPAQTALWSRVAPADRGGSYPRSS